MNNIFTYLIGNKCRKGLIGAILFAIAIFFPLNTVAQRPIWQEYNNRVSNLSSVRNTEDVDIYIKEGSIIISTSKKVQVKVFTILGQLVSQSAVGPGLFEMKIATRGIYLIKIDSITQKIVL